MYQLAGNLIQGCLALILYGIIQKMNGNLQTRLIILSYLLFEIIPTIVNYWKISEREKQAESDGDYFDKHAFNGYAIIFGALLCPSTKFLYCWVIPIYTLKYYFLMYGTDTAIT